MIDVLEWTGDKEKNQVSFYGIPLSSRHNLCVILILLESVQNNK